MASRHDLPHETWSPHGYDQWIDAPATQDSVGSNGFRSDGPARPSSQPSPRAFDHADMALTLSSPEARPSSAAQAPRKERDASVDGDDKDDLAHLTKAQLVARCGKMGISKTGTRERLISYLRDPENAPRSRRHRPSKMLTSPSASAKYDSDAADAESVVSDVTDESAVVETVAQRLFRAHRMEDPHQCFASWVETKSKEQTEMMLAKKCAALPDGAGVWSLIAGELGAEDEPPEDLTIADFLARRLHLRCGHFYSFCHELWLPTAFGFDHCNGRGCHKGEW